MDAYIIIYNNINIYIYMNTYTIKDMYMNM